MKNYFSLLFVTAFVSIVAIASAQEEGEKLERDMWNNIKVGDWPKVRSNLADGFQAIGWSGMMGREAYLQSLKETKLRDYTLSNFQVTGEGATIIVFYDCTLKRDIKKTLVPPPSKDRAGRTSISRQEKRGETAKVPLREESGRRVSLWLHNVGGWQLFCHVDMNPEEACSELEPHDPYDDYDPPEDRHGSPH
jgi:hypothetical protein